MENEMKAAIRFVTRQARDGVHMTGYQGPYALGASATPVSTRPYTVSTGDRARQSVKSIFQLKAIRRVLNRN